MSRHTADIAFLADKFLAMKPEPALTVGTQHFVMLLVVFLLQDMQCVFNCSSGSIPDGLVVT